jgi:hypothetical protein
MGWSGLGIFIRPLMVGAEGFQLMYFHLVSCGINVLLSFIIFLILSLEGFSWVCGRGLEVESYVFWIHIAEWVG